MDTIEPDRRSPLPASAAERLSELTRIMTKVAARDFSEKPSVFEGEDELSKFSIGFRFMIEDLENALRELERERAELQMANERLKELDRIKTRLINSAAHELGTPLTPIKLQVHMLRAAAHELPPRQQKALIVLERNVDRLMFLVHDMLDVARLESGHMDLHRERVEVMDLIRELSESFEGSAAKKGVSLEIEGQTGLVIDADPHRISQVLYNLVTNALKFTPEGGRVIVRADRQGGDIVVQVRDSGIGMEPGQIPRLFHAFTQVHDPVTISAGGTGLGLYISQGIVASHGGRIWAVSEGLGKGSTFGFSVPAVATGSAVVPVAQPAAKIY